MSSRQQFRGKFLRPADPAAIPDAGALRDSIASDFCAALFHDGGRPVGRTLEAWMDTAGTPTQFSIELPDGTTERFVEVDGNLPGARHDLRSCRRTTR